MHSMCPVAGGFTFHEQTSICSDVWDEHTEDETAFGTGHAYWRHGHLEKY